jgi:hypothetical protein
MSTPRPPAPARSFGAAHAGLVAVHLAQAALVYLIAGDIVIPVTHEVGSDATVPLLHVSMGAALAVFFVAAAVTHGASATVLRSTYEADLRGGRSRLRWAEFALSAPLLMLVIGLYAGVTDVTALALVVGATLVLVGCGWKHEALNPPGRRSSTTWPLWAGVAAATVPWSIIAAQLLGAQTSRAFALATFLSLFILWAGFGINQWLQFRKVGQWADHLYGERTYLVLSLVAKSALAWQLVAGSSLL